MAKDRDRDETAHWLTETWEESLQRLAWTWTAAMFVTIVAILLFGCSAAAEQGPKRDPWREQYPGLAPAGCITVWVDSGNCWVSDDASEPAQCIESGDPLIVRTEDDPNAFCVFGWNSGCDCNDRSLH